MNPLNTITSNLGNIGAMANMFKSLKSGNVDAMAQALMQQNPQFKQFVDSMQGKNPEQIFNEQCKKQGINPQQALQQVNQFFK